MRQPLIVHPTTPRGPVSEIVVEVVRSGRLLMLDYVVAGDIDALALPAEAERVRADRLWEQSCFEVFIGAQDDYLEINLAPSTAWAAYRFHGYRHAVRNAGIEPPDIATIRMEDRFELRATARINWWAGPIGLAAVIQEKNGTKSYWALAHPPGVPDFHHPDCFALELPAPDAR